MIVVFFSKDRVILAADSRVTYSGATNRHQDNQCKVSGLGREIIFAASGFTRYSFAPDQEAPRFDVYLEAVQASHAVKNEAPDRAKAIAEAWARRVKAALDVELVRHPNEIMSLLHGQSMQLAGGVFAGRNQNGLAVYYVAIQCECRRSHKHSSIHVSQIQPATDGMPAASIGTSETMGLFSEVADGTSPRGLAERDAWPATDAQPDRDAYVTVRTGEFILRHSTDRTVAGPINALELTAEGQVRWVKREKNCR